VEAMSDGKLDPEQYGEPIRNLREFFDTQILRPALATGLAKRILPRQRVYLWVYAGDGDKFARLFAETWRRMPLWARRRILRHWRNDPRAAFAGDLSPKIELTTHWKNREGTEKDGEMAAVARLGHYMAFADQVVARMPDAVVHDLVAHELAHVLQFASGYEIDRSISRDDDALWLAPNGSTLTAGDLETEADNIAENWGFRVESIDDWAVDAGISMAQGFSVSRWAEFDRTGRRW
jgi:hypothetical protein